MHGYDASTYGDRIAEVYDRWAGVPADTELAVAFLGDLAGAGPVLELGVGTGRIALPLAERGLEVHGVDASEAMVARLREKPGGAAIPVAIGDFAEVPAEGPFSLVFVVFNTFFGLLTQEAQVRCFANVAARLTPQGAFALEAFVPDVARFDRGQRIQTDAVDSEHVRLSGSRHDPLEQAVFSQHVVVGADGVRLYPVAIRYAWPSELDLMARLAGLRLRERWGGWAREPFTADSGRHVSVYARA